MQASPDLKVGDAAPPFSATATSGAVSLADYTGRQKLVLYFYPKADTPG
jgi:peroxiredoxin Q/BCP